MNKTIDEALDEIEKLFELGETAKACNLIQALITEARIEELEYWMDLDPHDITWNAMHIRISELRGGK